MPNKNIRMALIYDFDGTLAPDYMQNHSFLPEVGIMEPEKFWREVKQISKDEQADEILVYMNLMLEKAHNAKKPVNKKALEEYGEGIKLFPGVDDWFNCINSYADSKEVDIEHYLISSGNREIILGTNIAQKFDASKIFASKFLFNHNGIAIWPALAVNYTAKTQFLFRINKDISDISDDAAVNLFTPEDKRPIPFENMIFIGDGPTDIPCFKLVKNKGGMSIAVYRQGEKDTAQQYLDGDRVDLTALADYSQGEKIYKTVTRRIDWVVAKYALQNEIKL